MEKADRIIKPHQRDKRDEAGGADAEEEVGEGGGLFDEGKGEKGKWVRVMHTLRCFSALQMKWFFKKRKAKQLIGQITENMM